MTDARQAAQSRTEIEEVAAEYLRRRRFESWGESDQAELDTWLGQSDLRHVAFLRLEAGLARVERIAALKPYKAERRARAVSRLKFMMPIFASAVALALVAEFGVPYVRHLMEPPDRTYSTDIGGRALLNFADHTQIELNTDTLVRYRMTNDERTVWLEKGEAWFRVSHNAANPFTLIVGRHRVSDLGTEFVVRRGGSEVEIALLKGRAALSTEGAQSSVLRPGDDAVATLAATSITRKTPQELADQLAWQRGVLVFRQTPLAQVVREFNRYNETKLVLADPSIANVKVSAELKTDDYDDFLRLAQTLLNLRVERQGNDILISGRAPTAKTRAKRSATETVRQ